LEKLNPADSNIRSGYQIVSHAFFDALSRTTVNEKLAIVTIFTQGCPHNLPDEIHISFDLLRRLLGWSGLRFRKTLGNLNSLGFGIVFVSNKFKVTKAKEPKFVSLRWSCGSPGIEKLLGAVHNFTCVADLMIKTVAENYCREHGW
jgi:hypothetical protein